MRLAIIDLGTNSVRFDVVELGKGNEIRRLYREKLMIRLGEGVFLTRRLDAGAKALCLKAFYSFRRTLEDFRAVGVAGFATSALREARDGPAFVKDLKRLTGIPIDIISGEEEARLIARGILANEPSMRGRVALVDIGGGSTEISITQGRSITHSTSFPLGTARLQQIFLRTIPPLKASGSVENLRRHIRGILLYHLASEGWPSVGRVLASSGTSRALVKMIRRGFHVQQVTLPMLSEFVTMMEGKTRSALLAIPGMESRRVDMILAGAILLEETMMALRAKLIEITDYSLRDGILDEQIEILRSDRKAIRYDIVNEFFKAALSLGSDEAELLQTRHMAETLFDRFASLHRLSSQWKKYFVAASLLQDVGRSINPLRFEGHAAYIARNIDVSGLSESESRFIAELCEKQREQRLAKKDVPFKKDHARHSAFMKLLPLLQLTDAFSFQRKEPIEIKKLRIEGRVVRALISKQQKAHLEILRADQKKFLFEEIYRKALVFEQVNS